MRLFLVWYLLLQKWALWWSIAAFQCSVILFLWSTGSHLRWASFGVQFLLFSTANLVSLLFSTIWRGLGGARRVLWLILPPPQGSDCCLRVWWMHFCPFFVYSGFFVTTSCAWRMKHCSCHWCIYRFLCISATASASCWADAPLRFVTNSSNLWFGSMKCHDCCLFMAGYISS